MYCQHNTTESILMVKFVLIPSSIPTLNEESIVLPYTN